MKVPFTLGAVWHFGLAVRDPRASAKWFMRVSGLSKQFEYEGGVGIGNANTLIVFSKGKPSPKTIGHVAFHLPTMTALKKALAHLKKLREADPARREQVWALLRISEVQLATQFAAFAQDLARVDARHLRVSKLALGIPFAASLFPAATVDLRRLMAVHAEGIAQTVQNSRQLSPKDKAYTLSAELFLMQHTCHWYCKSRTVASARLLVRHKTAWAQVLDGVSPQTRAAYRTITGV